MAPGICRTAGATFWAPGICLGTAETFLAPDFTGFLVPGGPMGRRSCISDRWASGRSDERPLPVHVGARRRMRPGRRVSLDSTARLCTLMTQESVLHERCQRTRARPLELDAMIGNELKNLGPEPPGCRTFVEVVSHAHGPPAYSSLGPTLALLLDIRQGPGISDLFSHAQVNLQARVSAISLWPSKFR